MLIHEAVWIFAERSGNDHARKYASLRNGTTGTDRLKKDSKWLRGHGGRRLRELRYQVPLHDREPMMQKHPDPTFPSGFDGIFDERRRSSQQRGSKRMLQNSPANDNIDSENEDPDLQRQFEFLSAARSSYHLLASREHVQTEYNRGGFSGVVETTILSMKHAILFARSKDRATTPDEAFAAVCGRVTDVIASALGIIRFEPEVVSESEEPSAQFAEAKIKKAFDTYKRCVLEVRYVARQKYFARS
ncbi:hypothetical protein GN244_ATG15378 [Phytophthora infestans]|uniref:Uncharacterized protein n=1 Tax=Phytophthora infestans TaxID=4787 RepID=A0A833SD53_PHYIN|nr:hypothetical protein GN244_ATG15378 [Phytophthora infestans]KAF4142841.1 hypothetical protein GN958_ATG07978 [Phytophthora infestans]